MAYQELQIKKLEDTIEEFRILIRNLAKENIDFANRLQEIRDASQRRPAYSGYDPKVPTHKGMVGGHELEIYGFIKGARRICGPCRNMAQNSEANITFFSRLPCQWANKQMSGHWYKFPRALEMKYHELRGMRNSDNVIDVEL